MKETAQKQLAMQEPTPVVESAPMSMLQVAVQRGDSAEQIGKLMDLAERWNANQARKAFVAAMAQFKQNPPVIAKDKLVSFTTGRGQTQYHHATLANVCEKIIHGLSSVGISHRWHTEQAEARIKVTCILTHVEGHSESTSLSASPDDSGGKNSIQAIGSAVAYLQRYTLLAATGLATGTTDDDGSGGGEEADPEYEAECSALLDSLRSAATEGTQALLAAFKSVPASQAKTRVWADHAASLKAQAAAAGQ